MRRPRRWMAFWLCFTVLLVTASTVALSAASASGAARPGWNSGVYPGGGINSATAAEFAAYVGRPVDNVHVFPEPSTWNEIGYDTWEVRQYAGYPGELVIDVPLLPSEQAGSLADVAAGIDDRYFTSMAQNLVSLGRANSVLVLGSEFNGNWETYSAFKPSVYIAAFRHVVGLFRAISPSFVIDWTGNAIDNQSGHNPFTEDYPGDDVVDIVGVDAYDYAESRIDQAGFDRWADQPFGIQAWANFALDHHKPFSVPEWGLTTAASQWGGPSDLGSGDDAAYIAGMFNFFKANAANLAFEDYFNQPNKPNQNSLDAPVQMPLAAQKYKALWSTLPTPAPPIMAPTSPATTPPTTTPPTTTPPTTTPPRPPRRAAIHVRPNNSVRAPGHPRRLVVSLERIPRGRLLLKLKARGRWRTISHRYIGQKRRIRFVVKPHHTHVYIAVSGRCRSNRVTLKVGRRGAVRPAHSSRAS